MAEQTPGSVPLLKVDSLSAFYGEAQALRDVSLDVAPGEVVTLVGRNGAGKTTLLRSIMGLHKSVRGSVSFAGTSVDGKSADKRARAGLGWVPDDRGIYATLTVAENLSLPPVVNKEAAWSLDQIYDQFPVLRERRDFPGTKLSGGEQQMLAIGRALMSNPRLIIMDEPSEGLAPSVVDHLAEVFTALVGEGQAVLLVEQNLRFATELCERVLIMVNGRLTTEVPARELAADQELQARHLGIS